MLDCLPHTNKNLLKRILRFPTSPIDHTPKGRICKITNQFQLTENKETTAHHDHLLGLVIGWRSVLSMKTYTTRLSPEEIRDRLDPFLPVPWSISSRKPFRKAVVEFSHSFKPPAFVGAVGPGWFKLTIMPKGKSPVPTLYGTFESQGNYSRVNLEFGHLFQDLLSIVVSCALLIVALNSFIITKEYPKGLFFLFMSIVLLILTQHLLRHYKKLSEERILDLLELEPETIDKK
jgi:hypothetical protein